MLIEMPVRLLAFSTQLAAVSPSQQQRPEVSTVNICRVCCHISVNSLRTQLVESLSAIRYANLLTFENQLPKGPVSAYGECAVR